MTTLDPITTARIAIERMAYHDRYCVKIGKTTINTRYDGKPTGSPVTFTFRADASRAAYIAREAVKIATADLNAEITRLTSQLEQADRVIADLDRWRLVIESAVRNDDPRNLTNGRHDAIVELVKSASQWIKDRQAKTDHYADVGKMIDPLSIGDK